MGKRIIYISIISLIFVIGYWASVGNDTTGNSIEEALFHYTQNSTVEYGDILEKVLIEHGYLVFYEYDCMGVNSAIIKKTWNGKWKVTDISGSAPTISDSRQTMPFYWTGAEDKDVIFYWGLIYDNEITNVKVDNEEATIIKVNPDIILWYFQHDSSSRPMEINAYDVNGKLIKWD